MHLFIGITVTSASWQRSKLNPISLCPMTFPGSFPENLLLNQWFTIQTYVQNSLDLQRRTGFSSTCSPTISLCFIWRSFWILIPSLSNKCAVSFSIIWSVNLHGIPPVRSLTKLLTGKGIKVRLLQTFLATSFQFQKSSWILFSIQLSSSCFRYVIIPECCYKDTMGDSVKILIKVKISQVYCFPLIHITLTNA